MAINGQKQTCVTDAWGVKGPVEKQAASLDLKKNIKAWRTLRMDNYTEERRHISVTVLLSSWENLLQGHVLHTQH